MNFGEIRIKFDGMVRTLGLSEMTDWRDRWLNQGWEQISELFVVPSLMETVYVDSVADQQEYLFPYDYNGTEAYIKYSNRRLDPVPDETLALKYERRTGNMGRVKFYDWSGIAGSDLLTISDCVLTNGSATVSTASTSTYLDEEYWIRFDPTVDSDDDLDSNPGDFGYLISAGGQTSGESFTLSKPYRGPSGTFVGRVRPAEQQQFKTYGIPASSTTDAFEIRYARRPTRLFNASDVPEWPSMGEPIANMGVAVGLDFHGQTELSQKYWGRAMGRIGGLQRRREHSKSLVTDLAIGSVIGRKTGPQGIYTRRIGLSR